jgi:hypothetical protein
MHFKSAASLWGIAVAFLLMSSVATAQVVDHSGGFTGQTDLTLNGTQNGNPAPVTVAAGNLQVTDAQASEAKSAFRTLAIPADRFRTTFNFHLLPGSTGAGTGMADGMGFCIQNTAPTALGAQGGQMGYQGILKSIFVKFDNYGGGVVYSATGLYQNGADPASGAGDTNLLPAPTIDFQSGHDFNCVMDYNGTKLTVTLTDLSNNNVATQTYTVDIPTQLGGTTGFVGFCGGTGGLNAIQEVMTWVYVTAPTGVTTTPASNQVTVNWNAVAGATSYNIYRGAGSGGPYSTTVATGVAGLSAVDNNAAFPNTYYYVVRAVVAGFEGPDSIEATGTPLPPPISASPTTITTSESGTFQDLTLTINVQPTAAATVQITSSKPAEALVQGQGNGDVTLQGPAGQITININSGTTVGTTFTIRVTGQPDNVDDGDQAYKISFIVTGGGTAWGTPTIPDVNGTNLDINTAALLVSPTAGLKTTTNGGFDTFTVQLNSKPAAPGSVTINLTVSLNPTEVSLSTSQIVFDTTTWNQPVTVTVTGLGTNITYVNTPFTISLNVLAGDPVYVGMTSSVTGTNIHLEVPPALKHVWGSGGGGGGCGLLGAEVLLPLGLVALFWRRRRPA